MTDANAALLAAETGAVGETLNASLAALRVLRSAGLFAAPPDAAAAALPPQQGTRSAP